MSRCDEPWRRGSAAVSWIARLYSCSPISSFRVSFHWQTLSSTNRNCESAFWVHW